jgi:hypothetical protein
MATTKKKPGKRMTKGTWKLEPKSGKPRVFSGALMGTFNFGKKRIAVFSCPKRFK